MTAIAARITAVRQETPTTRSFTLQLESEGFSFLPGQWVDFYAEIDGKLQVAGYSLISVPSENRTVDVAVKRVGDNPVTRYLHEGVGVGDMVYVDGGYGDFAFTRDMSDSIVLISGGIGVTPLLGILRYVRASAPDVRATLVYSAGTPDELLFRQEFEEMERDNPNVRCLLTVTRPVGDEWTGRTGRIDARLLREAHIDDRTLFYVCGPREMVESMLAMLVAEGIPGERVKFETW